MTVGPEDHHRNEAAEAALARWLRTRAVADRNALVEHYWYLCRRAAIRIRREGLDLDDAEQVAALGLIKAADYYRADAGVPFEAYAWRMTVGELLHHVRDATPLVRAPRHLRATERRIAEARESLRQRLLREPSPAEVANAAGLTRIEIDAAECSRRCVRAEDLSARSDAAARDLPIADRVALGMALERLDARERLLVLATYGCGRTQAELGAHLGCSQRHVSRLLGKALRKMAQELS